MNEYAWKYSLAQWYGFIFTNLGVMSAVVDSWLQSKFIIDTLQYTICIALANDQNSRDHVSYQTQSNISNKFVSSISIHWLTLYNYCARISLE